MAKKTITITLKVRELVYDVMNKTKLTADSRYNGGNDAEVAAMTASEDDEHVYQIMRSMTKAYQGLRIKLAEWLDGTETTASNAVLSDKADITLEMRLPSNYNLAMNTSIATAVHEYLVHSTLAEWFVITNKADAGDYVQLAGGNLDAIRQAINKRTRPVRPTP